MTSLTHHLRANLREKAILSTGKEVLGNWEDSSSVRFLPFHHLGSHFKTPIRPLKQGRTDSTPQTGAVLIKASESTPLLLAQKP